MLSSSFLEVLCLWASLFANNFVQVTLTSFQKLFPSSQNGGKEMVVRFEFIPELLWRIRGSVDLSSQPLLCLTKSRRQVGETCAANDHHIHVTHRMYSASCHGPIYKGTPNLVPKGLQ